MSDRPISVSDAVHKAAIKVNEEGSEAAALTAVSNLESGSLGFVVDKPFIFFIVHRRSAIPLFVGRIVNPTL
jgi:serpin B